MKKKQRGIILLVLVIILAVCVAGYAALRVANEAADEEETAEDAGEAEALFPMADDANLVSLSYEREGESIRLIWSDEDEAWQREGMTDYPVDTSTVSMIAGYLTDATVSRVINEDGSNLAEYGLEDPAYTVSVMDSTGYSATFYIGDENSINGGCYVMEEGDGRVLMADEILATAFNYGWYDLASVDDGPGIDRKNIEDITVAQGDTLTTLEYDGDGKPETDITGSCTLYIRTEDGYQAIPSADQSSICSAVEDISYGTLAAYRPDEEELAELGLADPAAVITVNYTTEEEVEAESDGEDADDAEDADEEETEAAETVTVIEEHTYVLTIGFFDEELDCYYVQHDDGSSVFTMDADMVEDLLDLDPASMIRLDAANVAEDTIDSFDVSYDGKTVTYAIERDVAISEEDADTGETDAGDSEEEAADDEEEDAVTTTTVYWLDGEETGEEEYTAALDAVTSLEGARLLEEGEAVSGPAEITITFHRNTSVRTTYTVTLIPYNENYYQMAVDGETPFTVVDIVTVSELLETVFG